MTPISGCRQYIFTVVKEDAILLYEAINYLMTVLHSRLTTVSLYLSSLGNLLQLCQRLRAHLTPQ